MVAAKSAVKAPTQATTVMATGDCTKRKFMRATM